MIHPSISERGPSALLDSSESTVRTVAVHTALFTRLSGSENQAPIGAPSEFAIFPEEIDEEFARLATPTAQSLRTAGRAMLSPSLAPLEGAWVLRHSGTWTILTNLATVRLSAAQGGSYYGRYEDREDYLEQATFFIARDLWAGNANALFANLWTWLRQNGRGQVPTDLIRAPRVVLDNARPAWSPGATAKPVHTCLGTGLYDMREQARIPGSFTSVLNGCSAPDRYHLTLAQGLLKRIEGIDIQFFHAGQVSFGNALRLAGGKTDPGDDNCNIKRHELSRAFCKAPSEQLESLLAVVEHAWPSVYEQARPLVESLAIRGQTEEPQRFAVKNWIAAMVVLEQAYALTFEGGGLRRQVKNLYRAFLCDVIRQSRRLGRLVWEAASWLEFAPSLLAQHELPRDSDLSDRLLSVLSSLHDWDKPLFKRLVLRMPVPDDANTRDWDQVIQSSHSRLALQRDTEKAQLHHRAQLGEDVSRQAGFRIVRQGTRKVQTELSTAFASSRSFASAG